MSRARAAVLGTAAALLALPLIASPAAAAPPFAPGYGVGVASPGVDTLEVFYRRPDGGVTYAFRSDGPLPSIDLGGSVSTAPAAVSVENGTSWWTLVAAVGSNGAVYGRLKNGSWDAEWMPWQSIGGKTTVAPAVGCFALNPGALPLVWVRGGDGALWRKLIGSPWERLGGALGSAPAAASSVEGTCPTVQDVVALGTDKAVWEHRNGAWSRIGGKSAYAPSIVRLPTGVSFVFVVGTDGALWSARRESDDADWSGFGRAGGTFTSAPAAQVYGLSPFPVPTLTVIALGANGQPYRASKLADSGFPWEFGPLTLF